MGLAGEHEQNLWKEMSCRQNLEKQRLRNTELNLQVNKTYYLPLWGKSRSEVKGNRWLGGLRGGACGSICDYQLRESANQLHGLKAYRNHLADQTQDILRVIFPIRVIGDAAALVDRKSTRLN